MRLWFIWKIYELLKIYESNNRSLYLLDKKYLSQIHEHPLVFLEKCEDNGCFCSGKDLINGSFNNIQSTNQSAGIPRFKYEKCDYNLYESFMNF